MGDVISVINSGQVVCMPTDTVYGLVVSAKSPAAVKKLYETKGRIGKPGTIIAASVEQLIELGFSERDLNLASKYWPGPVSIVLPAPKSLEYLHMGLNSLAVRIPDNDELQKLLEQTGPLATTSANRPGEPTVQTIKEAEEIFADSVSTYIDGGRIDGAPSEIHSLENKSFTKIR